MNEAFDNAVKDCDVTYCEIIMEDGLAAHPCLGFNERLAAIGCTEISRCVITFFPDGTFTIKGAR